MENKSNTPINPYIVAISVLLPSFLSLAASSATNVCQPNIAGYYGATQYEANTVITCYINFRRNNVTCYRIFSSING